MDWADVPAWGALVVALAAAVFSGIALRHSAASAKAAKESADSSHRSATAAERSAAADEATLAEMQREAAERRAAEAEAARPKPDLRIAQTSQVQYLLRNHGTGVAVNVTAVRAGQLNQCRNLPEGVTLQPGEGHEFQIMKAFGLDPVTAIHVKWDGQSEPVALPVPQ